MCQWWRPEVCPQGLVGLHLQICHAKLTIYTTMLSDKFLFCFAINIFHLHSNSVISGAGDIPPSTVHSNYQRHGRRVCHWSRGAREWYIGLGIYRRSEERDGVPVQGNFKNFFCFFLLRINGITRYKYVIRIRFITSCPYYVTMYNVKLSSVFCKFTWRKKSKNAGLSYPCWPVVNLN